MIPTSKEAKRICDLFSRKHTTEWSKKEIRAFRAINGLITDEHMIVMERYYKAQRKNGDKGIHRRDISTFLNNFQGELDRAKAWAKQHPVNRPVERIRAPYLELTDEQIEKNKAVIAEHVAKLKRLMAAPTIVREAAIMFDAKLAD